MKVFQELRDLPKNVSFMMSAAKQEMSHSLSQVNSNQGTQLLNGFALRQFPARSSDISDLQLPETPLFSGLKVLLFPRTGSFRFADFAGSMRASGLMFKPEANLETHQTSLREIWMCNDHCNLIIINDH